MEENSNLQTADMHVESNRLKTFENWPNLNISPLSLVKAGFYYLNRSDEVKCAWCQGVIAKWERQDDPWFEHQRFFPECPRVQLGPLIEVASDGMRDLGIHQNSPPKKPKFSSFDARLRTYTDWPIPDIQKPEKLAQAGLYYQNVDDQVRCFHCSIGLRSWEKEDDPWFEHARWCPECQFVRLVKGCNYVQQVQETVRQSANTAISNSTSIDEAMGTSPVLQALEMGVDVGSIRNATQQQLLATGRPFDTVENLLKAVFGDDDTSSDSEIPPRSSTSDEDLGTNTIANEMSRLLRRTFGATENINQPPQTTILNCTSNDATLSQLETEPSTSAKVLNIDSHNTNGTVAFQNSPAACGHYSLEEENRRLKDARLCKICLDDEVGVVFLPCGHLVTCVQCANSVNQCPMCRNVIKGFVRTYLS